jgi:hypothetical protein
MFKTMSKIIHLIRSTMETPSDFRENSKMIVAFSLAAGCWISYGVLIHTQFSASREAAAKITAFADPQKAISPDDEKRISIIKDANAVVNQTASSIYSLLTPIATAVTGYFFLSSGFKSSNSTEEEKPSDPDSKKIEMPEVPPSTVVPPSSTGNTPGG